MALTYGVLKGRVTSEPVLKGSKRPGETQYHLLLDLDVPSGSGSSTWQAAVNVGTNNANDLLKYRLVAGFQHPIRDLLTALAGGFRELTGQSASPALDFLRGDFLAGTGTWRDSDVMNGSEQLEPIVGLKRLLETARQQGADTYFFGRAYKTGFGVHDIHMNQGSTGSFLNDGVDDHNDHNDVWQDGAVLIDLGAQGWTAYFTAFTRQLVPTDKLGNPMAGAHPIGDSDPGGLVGH